MINKEQLTQVLRGQNPVIYFFKELHDRFGVSVDFEIISDRSIRQIDYNVMEPSTPVYSMTTKDPLSMDVGITKRSVDLQELLIYLMLPYEVIRDKADITQLVSNKLKFRIGDVIKTQKFAKAPVQWVQGRSSRIFLSEFRVMGSERYDCCAYEIAAKCRVGIVLSTFLHEKIINTTCCECGKRLKCTLIPERMCKMSYLMESYEKFREI